MTERGIYLVNGSGEMTPLVTENGAGDENLLEEAIEEQTQLKVTEEEYDHLDLLERRVRGELERVKTDMETIEERGASEDSEAFTWGKAKKRTLITVLSWINSDCLHPTERVTESYDYGKPDGAFCRRCGSEL